MMSLKIGHERSISGKALVRVVFLAVMVAILAAACLPPPTDSGVEGYMTAGPTCPVVQVGVPCPDRPHQGTLTILASNGRTRIASVTADTAGYYRIALAPGAYVLHPEWTDMLPRANDVAIVVQPHAFTRQDIVYDTGIR